MVNPMNYLATAIPASHPASSAVLTKCRELFLQAWYTIVEKALYVHPRVVAFQIWEDLNT